MRRIPAMPLAARDALAFLAAPLLSGAILVLAVPVGQAQDEAATVQTGADGKFLTDADGMSLYLFEADSENTSTCYDDCAAAWPPLLSEGAPSAGGEVDASMLSTIERDDGTTQVTYDGWPLYHFVKDKAAGDMNGQDVEGFGAEWYLVAPDGEKYEE